MWLLGSLIEVSQGRGRTFSKRHYLIYILTVVPRPDLSLAELNVRCVLSSHVPSSGLLFLPGSNRQWFQHSFPPWVLSHWMPMGGSKPRARGKSCQCPFLDALFAFVLKYPGSQAQSSVTALPDACDYLKPLDSSQGPSIIHPPWLQGLLPWRSILKMGFECLHPWEEEK